MEEDYWEYKKNEAIYVDSKKIHFEPTGSFYKDIVTYCELARIQVHPSFIKPKKVILEGALIEEMLKKFEETKKENKGQDQEPEVLTFYTIRIDKNSLHALHAVLPSSKIRTLKFANNDFTFENFALLLKCIKASTITRLTFDWNKLPKTDQALVDELIENEEKKVKENNIEEEPIRQIKNSPFVPLYIICLIV